MKKELREVALDAELTLSDGTPVRLGLPAPPAPARSSKWPWLLLAALLGYGLWFSQQPWLFIDGPRVVSGDPQGIQPLLCERLIADLQPGLDSTQSWLPPLDNIRRDSRCLNAKPTLETLTAQALAFVGVPTERLALDAIQTPEGWALQASLGPMQDRLTIESSQALALIEPLRQLTLNVLDPRIAAQRHVLDGQPELALQTLADRQGPIADLTRARALRDMGRLDQAWMLYEKHSTGTHAGLAQLALAELAATRGQPEMAHRWLAQASDAPITLRIEMALQLGRLEWARDWLSQLSGDTALPYRARLMQAQGQWLQATQTFSQIPAQSLTDQDRILWANALEQLGQYPRAMQLLSQLPPEQAPLAMAKLEFHQGEVEQALAALESLNSAAARELLVTWLLWDRQLDRAEVHLNLMSPSDAHSGLTVQWQLAKGQTSQAQQTAEAIQNPGLRAWHLALAALKTGDTAAIQEQFQTLAPLDSDRANYVGARLNLLGGHRQAAQQSLDSMGQDPELALHRARLAILLDDFDSADLSPGQQALLGIAQPRVEQAMARQAFAQASQWASEYLRLRDDDPRMAPWLGLSYQAQALDQAALEAYAQALEGDELSLELAEQAAELADALQDWPRVVQFLSTFAADLNGPSLNRLLQGWVEQGDYDVAESWIRTAVVQSPDQEGLYVRWGQLLEGGGDLTGALSKYRQATQMAPASPEARLYLAHALNIRGEIDRAVAEAERAIERPLTLQQTELAADIFESAGLTGRATVVLERLPEGLHSAATKLRLARLLVAEGLNHSASQTFASVMNDQVTDARLWRTWGDALAALGQTNEALDKYKKAVRLTRQTEQRQPNL